MYLLLQKTIFCTAAGTQCWKQNQNVKTKAETGFIIKARTERRNWTELKSPIGQFGYVALYAP